MAETDKKQETAKPETERPVLTEDQKKQRIGELVRLAKHIQKWVDVSDNKDKKSALIGVSMYIQNRIKFLSGKIPHQEKKAHQEKKN